MGGVGAANGGCAGAADHAPAWRPPGSGRERVAASLKAIAGHPLVLAVLDAADVLLMVVDRERRVVAVNRDLGQLAPGPPDVLLGLRPGDALGCVESREAPDGCGSGERCAACGALQAYVESVATGTPATKDGFLALQRNGHLDAREFRVRATPIVLDGEPLTVVSLRDVSAERRRETLEHVFLHDLMNTIGGLHGWSLLLQESCQGEGRDIAKRIASLGERLRSEVEEHRTILSAEEGLLVPQLETTTAAAILADVERTYRAHRVAAGRHLVVLRQDETTVRTDRALLVRVIGNMVKNACEAVPPDGLVRVWSEGDANECRFRVWNAGAMPEPVRLRVFSRSFTTKGGPGRGLGTFAMKLLGERYLGGRVRFTSAEAGGTTFEIGLPRDGSRAVGGRT